MKKKRLLLFLTLLSLSPCFAQNIKGFKPFTPPVGYEEAGKRADDILAKMTIEEKIQFIGGLSGFKKYNIPELYVSDATAGVHIINGKPMEKSTSFPCPLALTATWNPTLANKYAKSIGEECRASNMAVLLGPGMNIYRISQDGRNFEYFGEDPFLAGGMVANYVTGMQSTGTITTLKHFLCNNTEFHRRTSNSIVDERTLHEIYLPAFKAGIDAGAMGVMTSYNQLNGEWTGQSPYAINKLLRKDLNYRWLVMTDWWSVYDPEKVIKSGQDLEMPGHPVDEISALKEIGNIYLRGNAKRLLDEGRVTESEINRMAKSVMRTFIAMGLYDRPVKDEKYLKNFPIHEDIALQTAREAVVLLRNEKNILPLTHVAKKKILLTGDYTEKIARGGGSAEVEGYHNVSMVDALKKEFGNSLDYVRNPTDDQLKSADVVLISVGTRDSEGWDKPFSLPDTTDKKIENAAKRNSKVIVIVNSGGGIKMTNWYNKVAGIVYAWYIGQSGNTALAEILSGKTNPSGKLPITIEKDFKDSPGYGYLHEGQQLNNNWNDDMNMKLPIHNIVYKEGVFVGYRWYEMKKIEPLYHFGFGLSYTTFEYGHLKVANTLFKKGDQVIVTFTVKNTGKVAGAEIAQLYVQDLKASVVRPEKELKGFKKVFLNPGETKTVKMMLNNKDFAYWDVNKHDWFAEPGGFNLLVGAASNDIRQAIKVTLK